MKKCCLHCHSGGVGCQMFCREYKSAFDEVLKINKIKNKNELSELALLRRKNHGKTK